MFTLILQLLETGLSLWETKLKQKYTDKLLSLKQQYYSEWNKPLDQRSDAVLDNIEFQLRSLAREFTNDAGTQVPK